MSVICFDCDMTLFKYSDNIEVVGEPIPHTVEALRKLYDMGHTIIIFSGRPTEQIISVVKKYELPVHKVNDVLLMPSPEIKDDPSGVKPHYDVIIDDKALNPRDYGSADELVDAILNFGEVQNKVMSFCILLGKSR